MFVPRGLSRPARGLALPRPPNECVRQTGAMPVWIRLGHRLLVDLNAARADSSYRRRFARLCSLDLLAIGDLGL